MLSTKIAMPYLKSNDILLFLFLCKSVVVYGFRYYIIETLSNRSLAFFISLRGGKKKKKFRNKSLMVTPVFSVT